jgi:trehalose 6-phosphate synthase/phosphatase
MKKYILNTNLLFHASRLNRKDAYSVLLGNQYKTLESPNKSSKIDVRYEQESSKINIYIKPRCYINNYIFDKSFIYVGPIDTDWTISELDYPYIEEICMSHNIIPIFDTDTELHKMMNDILNSDTFNYTHSKLNHTCIHKEYINFNKKVLSKLEEVADFDKDILWAQDLNFLYVVSKFKNSILHIEKFNELWKCVPFYKDLLDNILKTKVLNFSNKEDIKEFNKFIKYTYFNKEIPNPKCMSTIIGIDKSFIDTVLPKSISFEKNTILIPYSSIHHMICLDKYINKYDVPIKIYLLNINIGKSINQEVLSYITYLQMKTDVEIINPETDSEFYEIISRSQIGFYKSLDDTFLYFNRHVIENSEYDYEKVADEIYKKLHYMERIDKTIKDINDSKNEILDMIISHSDVEYLNRNIQDKKKYIIEEVKFKVDENKVNESDIKNDENINNLTECENLNDSTTEKKDSNTFSEATRLIEKLHLSKKSSDILNRPIKSLILDYDGTLVPLRNNPDDCFLPENVKELLLNLNKHIKVVICSGRSKGDMDKFIPEELEVYAEHVSFVRKNGVWTELRETIDFELEYKIANFYADRTPGSTLERKSNGFAFHYRNCEDFIGHSQAKKLYTDLIKISENIKLGSNIVEFKCTSKEDIFKYYDKDLMICGDDVTDEDMFDRCRGVTIKVGESDATKAEYCVKDVSNIIGVLHTLYKKISSK